MTEQKQSFQSIIDAQAREIAEMRADKTRLENIIISAKESVKVAQAQYDAKDKQIAELKEQLEARVKMHNTSREHERQLVHEVTQLEKQLAAKEQRIAELTADPECPNCSYRKQALGQKGDQDGD